MGLNVHPFLINASQIIKQNSDERKSCILSMFKMRLTDNWPCVCLQLTNGSLEWVDNPKEALIDRCMSELRVNTTLNTHDNNTESIADQIRNIACPNNCSNVGTCVNGRSSVRLYSQSLEYRCFSEIHVVLMSKNE